MAKLLREKYKTYEGARKRAGFENGIAASEYRNGYKAKLYHYAIVADPSGDGWRVQRRDPVRLMAIPAEKPLSAPLAALRHHVSGAIERGEAAAIVEKKAP